MGLRMTHLYLVTALSAIPAGTRCRIFGQIDDGRTVVQTSDPLSLDPLDPSIAVWDGMQANGIHIGIDGDTPGQWQVWQGEEPAPVDYSLSDKAAAVRALLKSSGKVPEQALGMVDMLESAVKTLDGGTEINDGQTATRLTQQILDAPQVQARPQLAGAIGEALTQIQTMVGGAL